MKPKFYDPSPSTPTPSDSISLSALRGYETAAAVRLVGPQAYVQCTYDWIKLAVASHDFSWKGRKLAVAPEPNSPVAHWGHVLVATELRVSRDAGPLEVSFYSVNDENPLLTMASAPLVINGPVRIVDKKIVAASGDVLGHLTHAGYWRHDGRRFSDVSVRPARSQ